MPIELKEICIATIPPENEVGFVVSINHFPYRKKELLQLQNPTLVTLCGMLNWAPKFGESNENTLMRTLLAFTHLERK